MTVSIFNVAKAPMGWAVYCDGVKIGGLYGSKDAAFEAATLAASFAVQEGSGVEVNVPDAPGSDEIPSKWFCGNQLI